MPDSMRRRCYTASRPSTLVAAARYERFARFLKDQGLIAEALPAEAYGVELR